MKGIIWNLTGEKSETAQVGIPGRVKLFDCGEEHCLAVTEENEVYSWGNSLYDHLPGIEQAQAPIKL